MRNVVIRVEDPASPAARELIERLDKLLTSLYPAESNHLLSVEALREPNVTFLTASVDGEVAGCGAFVNQSEALLLYEKADYQHRGPFGDYSEDPLSIFMEKKL